MLTWRLFWDGRVGLLPKAIPLLAVAYMISPLDLAPALAMGPFAPIGVLDDVGIMIFALYLFIQASPPDLVQEHLREMGIANDTVPDGLDDDDVIDGQAEVIDE